MSDSPSAALTLILATTPNTVAKRYTAGEGGKLEKTAIANITAGNGETVAVPDAPTLAALLRRVTTSRDLVLCTGIMHNHQGQPFQVIAEGALARRLRQPEGEVEGGVHVIGSERVAARLKRGMDPSPWTLIEIDNPPGIPEEWAALGLRDRLEMMEAACPGISTCERIELRGSSARVHREGDEPGGPTHAWVRISDPAKLEVLRHAVGVSAALTNLSFPSPRYSRSEPGKVVGYARRTLIDLAPWDRGRLVFVAQPDVQALGFVAADADIRIVNEGAGVLDVSGVQLPDDDALHDYAEATGSKLEISSSKTGVAVRSIGELTWDTEIERKSKVKTLRAWIAEMKPGSKLRCETPFRASKSEAAVLRLGKANAPTLHDVGSGITYHLSDADAAAPPPKAAGGPAAGANFGDFELTEDGVALAFEQKHREDLRYCHDSGAWFAWTGSHWAKNKTGLAFDWARNLARDLNRGEDEKGKARTGRAAFANAVETMAQRARCLAVDAEVWDTDIMLLGTPGGVVDLRTGILRTARREDYITRQAAVAPADTADCPLWLAFLRQATKDDKDLIRFLQQWCGYCLTGSIREQALIYVHGAGGNGKGVFLNTVAFLLADYHHTAAMDTFTEDGLSAHKTFLAAMRGARMVAASETEQGRAWAESRIKLMTGGDPITANFMRRDPFTYIPQFKLTIIGNHHPKLKNVDEAARRRFNIVPFVHKPATPDRDLEAKLKAEAPGILRWMIQGCVDWQRNGLLRPRVVTDATKDYFETQDIVGRWIEERGIVDPVLQEKPGRLLQDCQAWARGNGEDVPSASIFRGAIERTPGLRYKKVNGLQWVQGLGLQRSPQDGGEEG